MQMPRSAVVLALSAAVVLGLAGCVGLPFLPGSGGSSSSQSSGGESSSTSSGIEDTSWAGTDSDGDTWKITFQDGGGVAFSYDDKTYDDDTDTWALGGDSLTISIVFDEGTAVMTGQFVDSDTTISLDGREGDATWTLDLDPA